MAGPRILEASAFDVEYAVEAGQEEECPPAIRTKEAVHFAHEFVRRQSLARRHSQNGPADGHVHRRAESFAGDVADGEGEPPVIKCEEVEKVAADLRGRRHG